MKNLYKSFLLFLSLWFSFATITCVIEIYCKIKVEYNQISVFFKASIITCIFWAWFYYLNLKKEKK